MDRRKTVEQLKEILPKNYRWKCEYAIKEKLKGRAKGGVIRE